MAAAKKEEKGICPRGGQAAAADDERRAASAQANCEGANAAAWAASLRPLACRDGIALRSTARRHPSER